jgi:hypothetical protein
MDACHGAPLLNVASVGPTGRAKLDQSAGRVAGERFTEPCTAGGCSMSMGGATRRIRSPNCAATFVAFCKHPAADLAGARRSGQRLGIPFAGYARELPPGAVDHCLAFAWLQSRSVERQPWCWSSQATVTERMLDTESFRRSVIQKVIRFNRH